MRDHPWPLCETMAWSEGTQGRQAHRKSVSSVCNSCSAGAWKWVCLTSPLQTALAVRLACQPACPWCIQSRSGPCTAQQEHKGRSRCGTAPECNPTVTILETKCATPYGAGFENLGGGGGLRRGCIRREEGEVWDPKFCVPKMAQQDFPSGKFRFSHDGYFGMGGGGGSNGQVAMSKLGSGRACRTAFIAFCPFAIVRHFHSATCDLRFCPRPCFRWLYRRSGLYGGMRASWSGVSPSSCCFCSWPPSATPSWAETGPWVEKPSGHRIG